jgi:hypothetical protein
MHRRGLGNLCCPPLLLLAGHATTHAAASHNPLHYSRPTSRPVPSLHLSTSTLTGPTVCAHMKHTRQEHHCRCNLVVNPRTAQSPAKQIRQHPCQEGRIKSMANQPKHHLTAPGVFASINLPGPMRVITPTLRCPPSPSACQPHNSNWINLCLLTVSQQLGHVWVPDDAVKTSSAASTMGCLAA